MLWNIVQTFKIILRVDIHIEAQKKIGNFQWKYYWGYIYSNVSTKEKSVHSWL